MHSPSNSHPHSNISTTSSRTSQAISVAISCEWSLGPYLGDPRLRHAV